MVNRDQRFLFLLNALYKVFEFSKERAFEFGALWDNETSRCCVAYRFLREGERVSLATIEFYHSFTAAHLKAGEEGTEWFCPADF